MAQDPENHASQPSTNLIPSYPLTPASEEGPIHFSPKRTFKNSVAMVKYQEVLKQAREVIWRKRGQPVVELHTLQDCLVHALRGGLRSAGLAFSFRAFVNLVFNRSSLPRDYRPALIRHALFGEETWRFCAVLGTFTSLYKFLINAPPILIPSMNLSSEERRRQRSPSLARRAKLALIRKRVKRWHAALAGAVAGGLAIMCEDSNRRRFISQQMFVCGLQDSYNAFAAGRNFDIPYGDVIVFSLACGQIMYAWLLRRDTLPEFYSAWITSASMVPPEAVRINHDLVRTHEFDVKDFKSLLDKDWPHIAARNKSVLRDILDRFYTVPKVPITENPYTYLPSVLPPAPFTLMTPAGTAISRDNPESWYIPFYAHCRAVHPKTSSCILTIFDRFFAVFNWIFPIYSAFYLAPAMLFKMDKSKRKSTEVIAEASRASMRSSAFLGVFVSLYQILFCYKHKLHRTLTILRNSPNSGMFKHIPQWLINWLLSKPAFWLTGMISGLSLLVEPEWKRGHLALYVLPKGLESAWVMAMGKRSRTGKWGDIILTAIGMGMVMSTYQNEPRRLSVLVHRILYQLIGPN